MNNKIITLLFLVLAITAQNGWARNEVLDFSIQEALAQEQSKEKLGDDVRFYLGNQKHGTILKTWGEVGTNKKTNAFLKSDQEACTWAFLSAMIALKTRALREGGNAVIDIKSNYKGNETVSDTTFQCGAGNVVAGVALKGTVVKLK